MITYSQHSEGLYTSWRGSHSPPPPNDNVELVCIGDYMTVHVSGDDMTVHVCGGYMTVHASGGYMTVHVSGDYRLYMCVEAT